MKTKKVDQLYLSAVIAAIVVAVVAVGTFSMASEGYKLDLHPIWGISGLISYLLLLSVCWLLARGRKR